MPMLLRGFAYQQELSWSTLPVGVLRSKPRAPKFSGAASMKDLWLIFFGDRELLLDLQDLLGRMFSEETLHVRRKFVKKIAYGIRTQGTTKAAHRIPQAPITSRVVTILQGAAE